MRRGLLLLALLVLAAGCKSTTFVGKRVDNFTAYYNTFYNARKQFDTGVKALEKNDQAVDRTTFIPVFPQPAASGSTREFENAIKKSADVLRGHPSSKWIDDALLLIGKSYFYQQNYFGAEQKFDEVLAQPSALHDEANFWMARSLIAREAFDEAEEHLTVSLAREDLSSRWAALLHLAMGELYVRRADWERAVEELQSGLGDVRDSDVAARAAFLLGQVYEMRGDYEAAVGAYRRVERFKPLYELAYAAQLSAVRVAGMHTDPQWALQELRRMERDDKNFSYRAELAYLRGRILQSAGSADEAFLTYDRVLYDSDANITAVRGPVHYAIGELYRDVYGDYVMAAAHFDTAAAALNQKSATAGDAAAARQWTREAITDAGDLAVTFRRFADVRGAIARLDSLLYVGSLDDDAFEAYVLELRKARRLEMEQQEEELARRQTEEGFRNAVGPTGDPQHQSTAAAREGTTFLSYDDPVRVQQAMLVFVERWGERPLVPNWRRQEAITALVAQEGSVDGIERQEVVRTSVSATAVDDLPVIDISTFPRDPVSRTRVENERAMARYELANVLFLSMNEPDSAAAWYRMVIEQDRDRQVAQRAYYALAEVHRALGDTASARRLYGTILETNHDQALSTRIRERLGMPPADQTNVDTLAQAERDYAGAYALWQQGRHQQAYRRLLDVAARYDGTTVAPKAIMAAAHAYTDWAVGDSVSLYEPIVWPVADSVLLAARVLEPGDITAAPAIAAALPNTVVRQDSTLTLSPPVALADTAAVADSSANALAQAVPPPPATAVTVGQFYKAIARHYPESAYASLAERIIGALEADRPAPAVDSTALAATDSLAADSVAAGIALPTAQDEEGLVAADPEVDPGDTEALGEDLRSNETPAQRTLREARERSAARRAALEEARRAAEEGTPPDSSVSAGPMLP